MKKNKKQWLVFILSDIQDVQNRLDYLAVTLNRELQNITEDSEGTVKTYENVKEDC